jgi:heterodisulfide reductase subunit A
MSAVAIIGAGPAGIAAASVLSEQKHDVLLFEKEQHTLENVRNKALLFPDFMEAEQLTEALNAMLQSPLITLLSATEITDIKATGAQWTLIDQHAQKYTTDAVILATGYTPFEAERKEEYGYGIYNGVLTSLDLEQQLKTQKITNANGETPNRVLFLQCVGSRDEKTGNNYCSKVCCITAVKQAIEIKKMHPETEVYIFYMDLRMWGQSFEELYRIAQEQYNVNFVRGRISEAATTFDGKIQIKAEDTLVGMPLRMTTDMLILMVGMSPSAGTKKLAFLAQSSGEYGFAESLDRQLYDNLTTKKNFLLAGACKRPMSINDAINDGRAAATVVWGPKDKN